MTTTAQKSFNSTAAGQTAMAYDASSRGTALMMNRAIKAKGGVGWDDSMIATANDILLKAIKENLIEEWNSLVTPASAHN